MNFFIIEGGIILDYVYIFDLIEVYIKRFFIFYSYYEGVFLFFWKFILVWVVMIIVEYFYLKYNFLNLYYIFMMFVSNNKFKFCGCLYNSNYYLYLFKGSIDNLNKMFWKNIVYKLICY